MAEKPYHGLDAAFMILHVKVIPGAKKTLVKQEGEIWKVYLPQPALEGKANKALVDVLAEFFGVRKNQIEIIKGLKSRVKTINIDTI
ncbi:MAG: DUF167 domain-containing protein [Candidatus Omnitrophota bacterium]|jgi:uncharacterized protein (TIGR00251 family)|nr:DUF167 domain-containing protein [Candidatus Omnitrophota bacterium]